MEGKRPKGRPRFGMIDDPKEGSYINMKRTSEDRKGWRGWMPRICPAMQRTNDDMMVMIEYL